MSELIELIAFGFIVVPPAVFLVLCIGLLAALAWLGALVWRSARIIHATDHAPLVDSASQLPGLVKLVGTAEPTPRRGQEPSIVWQKSVSSREGGSGLRRRTSSVTGGTFRIVDAKGHCIVDAGRAQVVPTTRQMEGEVVFQEGDHYRTRAEIRRGDRLFALGRLHRRGDPSKRARSVACELRPAEGVLLVSGANERHVKILYGIWLVVQLPPALVCLALIVIGPSAHLSEYPAGDYGRLVSFVEMLIAHPLSLGAQDYHPAYAGTDAARQ